MPRHKLRQLRRPLAPPRQLRWQLRAPAQLCKAGILSCCFRDHESTGWLVTSVVFLKTASHILNVQLYEHCRIGGDFDTTKVILMDHLVLRVLLLA